MKKFYEYIANIIQNCLAFQRTRGMIAAKKTLKELMKIHKKNYGERATKLSAPNMHGF